MLDPHAVTLLGLGFILGLRHALDADHLAAVSTVLAERPSLQSSTFIGFFWGLGHTLMLLCVGFGVMALNLHIPDSLANLFEFAVGVMLVGLGASLARRLYLERWHWHRHDHDGGVHVHLHSHRLQLDHVHPHWYQGSLRPLLIGMAHGLAGSAALVLMVLSTVTGLGQGMGYILVFGAGSILGMVGVGLLLSIPVLCSISFGPRAYWTVQGFASLASIGLGLMIMVRIGLGGLS
jgi:ABC-type nickel/cobalt efflux system permease component RcnA